MNEGGGVFSRACGSLGSPNNNNENRTLVVTSSKSAFCEQALLRFQSILNLRPSNDHRAGK